MSAEYNPNKLGWGAAALTVAFTAALGFTAYTIHNKTYLHPRDPMATQVYQDRDAGGEHAPAAGGEHTPAKDSAGAAPAAAKH